jgi:hypothetical protein
LIVFAIQPPHRDAGEIDAVVRRVRELALGRLRKQISIAFEDDRRAKRTNEIARFALAAFDGAFLASQTDPGAMLGRLLAPLPAALVALRRALE